MFIVEGNIGAGKSTFLSMLSAATPSLKIVQEPVHNWASERYGQSLLEEFYKKPSRWAFTIETFAMLARSLDHVKSQRHSPKTPVLLERSIYSGHYCFALNDKQEGYFNDIEWAIYMQWVEFVLHQQCQPPRGFIYLRTSPEVCHQRVIKRNRSGEELVSFAYLKKIHEQHENFLVSKITLDKKLHHVPVLLLDVDEEFQDNPEVFAQLVAKTESFIQKNCPSWEV